jgi:hypothetical protein
MISRSNKNSLYMISGTHFPQRQLLKTIEKAFGNYQD